ncbi:MAG TPA: hypothetical protein DHW42_09935 [Candidatus Marinimicrobia bacterium]|nr:hypothetical protein [Candidatus Neomarinimicrobiota bacterium]
MVKYLVKKYLTCHLAIPPEQLLLCILPRFTQIKLFFFCSTDRLPKFLLSNFPKAALGTSFLQGVPLEKP